MSAKLIITFEKLSEAGFQFRFNTIVASLTDNPHYPAPWAPQVASLVMLSEAYDKYHVEFLAALSHDANKIAARNAARQALTLMLKQLAPYLEMVAAGDVAILKSTGYELRSDPVRNANAGPLPAPTGLRISHGALSGTLDVHVDKLAGAGNYEAQMTLSDPTDESGWKHAASSPTGSHILLQGLTMGQIIWIRVRGVGYGGNGAWSDPVRVVVN
ncbi:MAG: fibronectin type III domain-containing protein [Leptothrix sp. (in: b-proteobacteria)]